MTADLFGRALLDTHAGRSAGPILITRDDGHTDEHDAALYFTTTPFPHERPALEAVRGPVLDVGCGAGRHLLWLRDQRIAARGIDASSGAVEVCRLRGVADVRHVDVMEVDPGTLRGVAQTAVLFGNNVGIGGTFDGAVALFQRLRAVLRAPARLVLTGLDIANTTNPAHLAYHARNLSSGRRRGEIQMRFAYGGEEGPEIPWYHPEPAEVEDLAALSGWRVSHLDRREDGFFWAVLDAGD